MTRRIALAILVSACVMLIAGGVAAYVSVRETLLADLDRSILERATVLAQASGSLERSVQPTVAEGDRYVIRSDRGQTLGFEVVILPLRHVGPAFDRILGAVGAIERPYWLGVHPVVRQELTSLRLLTPDEDLSTPQFPARPSAEVIELSPGVVRRGAFVVHEGGKS